MTVEYRDKTPVTGDFQTNSIGYITKSIREKKYGKDVREILAQALEKAMLLANGSVSDQNSIARETVIILNELKGRLDNMTSTPDIDESTELSDARVDFMGTQHSNVGGAMRSSDSTVNSRINRITDVHGGFEPIFTGYIQKAFGGTVPTIEDNQHMHMKKIDVSPGDFFRVKAQPTLYNYPWVATDSSDTAISWGSKENNTSGILKTYELVVPSDATRLYVSSGVNNNVIVEKYFPSERFSEVFDKKNSLVKELVIFGGATYLSDGSLGVQVSSVNGGLMSESFSTNSNRVAIKISGEVTVPSYDVQIQYTTNSGNTRYLIIASEQKDISNKTFYFDAAYMAVYLDANLSSLKVVINSTNHETTPFAVGSIKLTNFSVVEESSFESSDLYDHNLLEILKKIVAQVDSNRSTLENLSSSGTIISPSGKKFRLTVSDSGEIQAVDLEVNKVVMFGNSLLLGLDTNSESGGPFGMCSSDWQHDYAYHITQYLENKSNSSVDVTKIHDAALEQAESTSSAQNWIDANSNISSDTDLILVQIGDNVNTATRKSVFLEKFPVFLQALKKSAPAARIIVASAWFNSDNIENSIRQIAVSSGAEFVDLSVLNTSQNQASVGGVITFKNGTTMTVPKRYATHPGDNGMQAIAEKIISKIG